MVENLLKANIDIDIIQSTTRLSMEEIKEIQISLD